MGRYSYPHTIDNGGGERITFARSVAVPNLLEPPRPSSRLTESICVIRERAQRA
jgi:hypothetical protein